MLDSQPLTHALYLFLTRQPLLREIRDGRPSHALPVRTEALLAFTPLGSLGDEVSCVERDVGEGVFRVLLL